MADDTVNHVDVLFGGWTGTATLEDTWTWNGITWTQKSPTTSPSAREGAVAAFDPLLGYTVLYGGSSGSAVLGDTWKWNGTTWTSLSPTASPPALEFPSMAYDPALSEVVLYGGYTNTAETTASSATWAFNGTTWTQIAVSSSPAARGQAQMAYDASASDMVLFGGNIPGTGYSNATYTLAGATPAWTAVSPFAAPSGTAAGSLVFDSALNRLVLFGGETSAGMNGNTYLWDAVTDTWLGSLASLAPTARVEAAVAPAEVNGQLLLFGGFNGTTNLADTQLFDWPKLGTSNGDRTLSVPVGDRSSLAVDLGDGNLAIGDEAVNLAGTGENLTYSENYNSDLGGGNWNLQYNYENLEVYSLPDGSIVLNGWNGAIGQYDFAAATAGTFTSPAGIGATLVYKSATNQDVLTVNRTQQVFTFAAPANPATPGQLQTIVDRNGDTITANYNGSGQMTSMTDTRARTVTDTVVLGSTPSLTVALPDTRQAKYTFNSSNQMTSAEDLASQTATYGYNANGDVNKITDPAGDQVLIGYDSAYRVDSITQVTNVAAQTGPTSYLTWQAVPAGTTVPTGTTAAYQVAVTDPNGHTSTYIDAYGGQTIQTVDALGHTQGAAYDTNRDQLASYDGLGNETQSTFSSDGLFNQLTSLAAASGTGQSAAMGDNAYNVAAQPAGGADPAGTGVAGYGYLSSSAVTPVGDCDNNSFDAHGDITTVWSGLASTGSGATRACNAPTGTPPAGAVATVTTYQGDPKTGGGTTTCTGATTGEACTATNGLAGATAYTYKTATGNQGALATVTPPTPQDPTSYNYDGASRVTSVTQTVAGASRTVTSSYDNDDRLHVSNDNATADPTCATAADCVTNTYNADGELTQTVDGSGTTLFTYDTLQRLTSILLPGHTITTCGTDTEIYTYDSAGNLTSYCDAGGTVSYTYDNANRLGGLADPGGSCTAGAVVQPCTTYSYDNANRDIKTTWPTSTGAVQCAGYDNASNLINLIAAKGTCTTGTNGSVSSTGTVLSSLSYHYSTAAAPTADTALQQYVTNNVTAATTSYGYDTLNRLYCATTLTFNATNCALTATSGNQYGYDADGNITTKVTNGSSVAYAYNNDNEMTTGSSSYNTAGDQTSTNNATTLGYNNYAQTNTMQISGGTAHTYNYTGNNQNTLISAAGTTLQNSTLGVTATTTSGATSYQSRNPAGGLATLRSGSASYYYLLDGNGNVTGLITSTGTLPTANTYTYDPYGNLTTGTPTGIAATNPFRYNSGLETADGTYHYGARYYNPVNGRWTQQDPTGQSPGYIYAGDDPINESDPTGLDCVLAQCEAPGFYGSGGSWNLYSDISGANQWWYSFGQYVRTVVTYCLEAC